VGILLLYYYSNDTLKTTGVIFKKAVEVRVRRDGYGGRAAGGREAGGCGRRSAMSSSAVLQMGMGKRCTEAPLRAFSEAEIVRDR